MQLGTAYLELAPSTRGLVPAIRKEMGQVSREMSSSGASAGGQYTEGFAGKVRGGLGRVMDGVLMGVGMKALDGLAGAARSVFDVAIGGGIDRALKLEGAEAKLTGLGHSAESVAAIMDSALGAVKGTAFGMGDAAAVAASAVAAGIEPGAELQRTLTLVGDAATIAGADMGEMGSVFNKVAASNKLQMDSVNQLQDRGIPVLQMVAKELGVTQEEASKMASAGKIDFETFQKAMEAGLGGAAQESGKTFAGAMANTKAALGRVAAGFATPILDGLKGLATAAIPMIDTVGAALAPVAEKLGGWIETQVPKITSFLESVPGKMKTFGDTVKGVWDLIAKGDFTGGLFGLEEDSPIVDTILTLRDGVVDVAGRFKDSLQPTLETVGAYIRDNLVPYWAAVAGVLLSVAGPAFDTISTIINNVVLPAFKWVSGFVTDNFLPILRDVAGFITERVLPTFSDVATYLGEKVGPVFANLGEKVIKPAFGLIMPILESFWDFVTNYVGPVLMWLWEEVAAPVFDGIGSLVENFGTAWARVWSDIQKAAAVPVNFVIDTVWNNGLRKVLNWVFEAFGGSAMAPIDTVDWGAAHHSLGGGGGGWRASGFAGGGYTGDGGKFDPAGVVHKGEWVFTKREVEAVGGPAAMRQLRDSIFHGYDEGGLVGDSGRTSYKGHTFSRLFASVLQLAERMAGTSFQISQGGFSRSVKASGTSHYGDAVDILSPITTAVITALRSAGVAAWDRTGKGNWGPHIHGVPLPGYGFAAGSGVWQAQDYLRGGDGLGGRDNGPQVAAAGVQTSGLSQIPEVLSGILDGLGELTGPWGRLLADGFGGMVEKVGGWVWDKVEELGEGIAEMLYGKRTGVLTGTGADRIPGHGYASGTGWASPGRAWVGEHGPEVIDFRGGERVYDAQESTTLGRGVTVQGDVILRPDMSQLRNLNEFDEFINDFERILMQNGATV